MKKYFAHLRPMERRLAVGVLVVVFLVLNFVFIWPHFSDWTNLRQRGDQARQKLKIYQDAIAQSSTNYEAQVKSLEGQGESVAPEDQAINFMKEINAQAAASGVRIDNFSHMATRTNDAFFIEQVQTITVNDADDKQLVDFLYNLGSGASMVRVNGLELQPDASHEHLNASIQLIASYQKKTARDSKSTTAKAK